MPRILFALGLLLAFTPARAEAPADVFKSAVAVWHMADAKDAAGHSDLKITGKVALGVKLAGDELRDSLTCGNDGLVAQFDGGYLDAGQGAGGVLNVAGSALTVSVRLRSPEATWELPIFSKHGGHDQLVYNLYSLGGDIGFELGTQDPNGLARTTLPAAKIGPRDWHTIICRYDGAKLEMFADGVLMDGAAPSGNLRTGNTVPCLIGAESNGGRIKTGWKGQIDHAALWNRALTNTEIEHLSGGGERIAKLKPEYLKEAPILPARPDLYREKYRPQFHVTARQWTTHKLNPGMREEGWINDVNGLIYHHGQYHLFAQRWARCWLHFVSKDLVHWTELQPAFWDDKRFGTGVQSGTIVFDSQNVSGLSPDPKTPPLVAFWSGFDNRSQCIAFSLDHGLTWTKYAKNPYMLHPERDPRVFWYEPTHQWVMMLYGDAHYHILNSTDLLHWTDQKNPIADCFECPDFFALPIDGDMSNQKWVLMRGDGRYSIGDFNGSKFIPYAAPLPCDLGENFYATQSWGDIPDAPGRRVQIAWMRGGKYPDMPFNQQLSFPCDLTLRSYSDGLRVCRQPAREIENLYGQKHAWTDQTLKPGENLLKDVPGELFDIRLQADLKGGTRLTLKCRGQTITYSPEKKTLTALGKDVPLDAPNGQLDLRVLVDRTSIEVFAAGGRISMTACYLPDADHQGLELSTEGGDPIQIRSLTIHELKPAWPTPN